MEHHLNGGDTSGARHWGQPSSCTPDLGGARAGCQTPRGCPGAEVIRLSATRGVDVAAEGRGRLRSMTHARS